MTKYLSLVAAAGLALALSCAGAPPAQPGEPFTGITFIKVTNTLSKTDAQKFARMDFDLYLWAPYTTTDKGFDGTLDYEPTGVEFKTLLKGDFDDKTFYAFRFTGRNLKPLTPTGTVSSKVYEVKRDDTINTDGVLKLLRVTAVQDHNQGKPLGTKGFVRIADIQENDADGYTVKFEFKD